MNIDTQSEEIRGARGKREDGGASYARGQSGYDARPAGWFWNIAASFVVISLAFVANNLYQINLTLAADAVGKQDIARRMAELAAAQDRNLVRDSQQEEHINAMDRRLVVVEQVTGVNSRGGRRGN